MKNIPKKRFLEFVNNGEWEEKELFEIIDFKSGYAFSSSKMSNKVQQYQLIKMSNVYQNILDLDRNPSYWEKINQIESEFLLETGDVVLTLTGTVGKKDYGYSVMIEENNKFLLNQRLVRFRAINERSVSKFIRNLVLHENFLNSFFINSRGGTGNQSNVSIEDLKQIKLPIPSLAEQQKIADCLSSVDSLILAQSQKVELLKEHKKGLLQNLFPTDGENRPKKRFPEFVNDGEWKEKKLGEVGEILQGYGFPERLQGKTQGKYPFYKVSDISVAVKDGNNFINSSNNYIDDDIIIELKAKIIPRGVTIFAKIGEAIRSNRRVITIQDCLIDNNTAGIKAIKERAKDLFIFYTMLKIDLIEYSGGVVPSISKTVL